MDNGDIDMLVAQRLQQLRQSHGITLTKLSQRTGISAAHLSRLEKGERQPSIGSLLQLARVYGVSIGQLVDDASGAGYSLLRAGDVTTHQYGGGRYGVLSGPAATVSVLQVELDPGTRTEDASHQGEEWLHILSGVVECVLGAEEIVMRKGDSLHFDSATTHRVANRAQRPATVLIVSTTGTTPAHHPTPFA